MRELPSIWNATAVAGWKCKAIWDFLAPVITPLPIYMNVEKKTVEGPCSLKPKVPTYWNAKPQRGIRRYRVAMSIHYRGDGGVTARVTSAGRELRPWQAYASYMLTGGYVFYGYCAKGYSMTRMQGPPVAKPDQLR